MYDRIICRRCLLEQLGEDGLVKTLEELKNALPDEQRSDSALYKKRLDICLECDELINGMCGKCGCYVEYRALRKNQYCPHENKKW